MIVLSHGMLAVFDLSLEITNQVRGSLQLLLFILWGTWISVQMTVHLIAVEIFQ